MGKEKWNPYLAGALVGLLAVASVIVSTNLIGKPKYLGASTTFVRVAGLIEQLVIPEHVAGNEYFQSKKVKVGPLFPEFGGGAAGAGSPLRRAGQKRSSGCGSGR